jgi:mannosylglycerate hydrolase
LGRGVSLEQAGGTEFWWQGLDESRLLVAFLATWYNNAQRFPEPSKAAAYVEAIVANLRAAGAQRHLLLMNGVDHLVAQENLSAILRHLDEHSAEWQLRHSTLPALFEALHAECGPHLHVLRGELRDETKGPLLTGVLSARTYLKQANAATEQLLERWVEPFLAFAALRGKPYDRGYLRYAWKLLLQNHPHDSICGCSLDQVHREMLPRFAQAQQVGEELLNSALRYLAAQIDTSAVEPVGEAAAALETTSVIIWNPLGHARSDVAEFELDFARRDAWCQVELLDPQGNLVPTQVLKRVQRTRKELSPIATPHEVPVSRYTVAAYFSDLPPCGYRAYTARLVLGQPPRGDGMIGIDRITNDKLSVSHGFDSSLSLNFSNKGLPFWNLNFFRDEGDVGDQYNYIKPLQDRVVETVRQAVEARVVCNGPVMSELEMTVRPRVPLRASADRQGRSAETVELPIISRVRLCRGAEFVEITTTVENTAQDHRLRAVFDLHMPVVKAAADTAFGVVERPVELPAFWAHTSRDRPHRSFIDVRAPEDERGFALLTRGLYEHDIRPNGELELTLLRCVGHMFVDVHTLEPLDAVTDGQCPGTHTFHYALLPHNGQLPIEAVAEAAARFNAPLRALQVAHHAGDAPEEAPLLEIRPQALQLSAIKWAEERDTLIVRCYNTTNEIVVGGLWAAGQWGAAYRVRLDETRHEELPPPDVSGWRALRVGPFEVVTIELVPE